MKIGLLRHLKTDFRFLKRCNSREYDNEYERYEQSHIIPVNETPSVGNYTICYTSIAPRAIETAAEVFKGEIIPAPGLIEVPLQAIFKTKVKLLITLWHVINRIGWVFNFKNLPETRNQTKARAIELLTGIIDSHTQNKSILLVSHGFFMVTLQSELLKRGFKGKGFIRPEHGKLYEFESHGMGDK